jgi:non-ribosomal peptide synthase protein (TIGR01720 family)
MVFNYLGQLDTVVNKQGKLQPSDIESGNGLGQDHKVQEKISLNLQITGGELIINWEYSTKHFDAETIENLANDYVLAIEEMIAHCLENVLEPVFTPSDFGIGEDIDIDALDKFLKSENFDANED